MFGGKTGKTCGKAGFIGALLLLMIILASLSALSADPPPFTTIGPDTVTTPTGKQSTLTLEKREYEKEDGTKVKEERLTQTVSKDGEVEYTQTTTWYSEEKGDDKLKFRRSETVDGKGNKTVFEQKEVTKRVEGGVRTDYYTEDKGKVFYSGYYMKWDKGAKAETKEKETIVPDKDGVATSKTRYVVSEDGNTTIETYAWHECDGGWVKTSSVKATESKPFALSPTLSTYGCSVGGKIIGGEQAVMAVASVVAVSESGPDVEVPVGPDGGFDFPGGMLLQGLYNLKLRMSEGSLVEASRMLVLRGGVSEPKLDTLPRFLFAGSTLSLTGSGLSGKSGELAPLLSLTGDAGSDLFEPISYSDMQAHFEVPENTVRGVSIVRVLTPDGIVDGGNINILSLDLVVPELIQVGVDFYVTVRITGLTGELLKESFTAIVSISGPAFFVGTDANRVLVELIQGEALLKARAIASGQFNLSGEIVKMPNF